MRGTAAARATRKQGKRPVIQVPHGMRRAILLLLIHSAVTFLQACSVFEAETVARPGTGYGGAGRALEAGRAVTRDSLRVMTFNIHWQGHDAGGFVDSGFVSRKPLVLDVLRNFDSDIIGLQEASIEQRAAMVHDLPGFGMFPLPTWPGDECILYRLDRFDLKDGGREYLRRVPEKPGTNIGVRDFFWVHLHDRTSGKGLYVINLHADHRSSKRGRELDAVSLGKWIRSREFPDPVIVTGDLNGTPDMPRYLFLTGQRVYPDEDGNTVRMPMPLLDTFGAANPDARFAGTINSGYQGKKTSNRIDYVFVPLGTKVIDSRIIYYQVNGSYPSDHYPLLSEFKLE